MIPQFKNLLLASTIIVGSGAIANAQEYPEFEIKEYRIESDDCPSYGCGYANPNDSALYGDYLASSNADRQEAVEARAANRAAVAGSSSKNNKKSKGNKGQGNALGQQDNSPQVVYLEFNPGDPTFPVFFDDGSLFAVFPDYIYSQADKDLIQSRMEADYEAYNYEFTQTAPSSGEFTTLTFGDNDAGNITLTSTGGISILFGRASNIDFRNDDRDDFAFIDASLWQFLGVLDTFNGSQNIANFLGIPPLSPAEIPGAINLAVRNQSSNTGSHELGHIQGLRHHDSFGAPGDGLPPAVDPGAYLPVLETDGNALETLNHIMASGASAGLSLAGSALEDRFFSERSAVKLATNARTRDLSEEAAMGGNDVLELRKLKSPNPLVTGVNADGGLDVHSALVNGRISAIDEVDAYNIKGEAGKVFNAEIISWSDDGFAEPIIGKLVLKFVEDDGSLTTVATNRLTFESIEPMIFDFELPATGDYVLEVSSPETIDFGGGVVFPLAAFGLGGFGVGDYDLHAYIAEGKMGGGPKTIGGPSN